MAEVKYPYIKVKMTGENGNAFAILGKVVQALKKHKIDKEEIAKFRTEAMSGDYDHLLGVCMQWVDCE